jgi:hypothetical protein
VGIYGKTAAKIDIAGVSAVMQPVVADWYNATIDIIKPDISGGVYNRATNTKARTPETIWTGPARIQAMRWPNVATSRQEAISARTVVFHIPLSVDIDPSLIHEGWRVRVTDGGMSPEFEGGLFVITGAVNSSYAWDRRIETTQDQGTTVS